MLLDGINSQTYQIEDIQKCFLSLIKVQKKTNQSVRLVWNPVNEAELWLTPLVESREIAIDLRKDGMLIGSKSFSINDLVFTIQSLLQEGLDAYMTEAKFGLNKFD